MACKRNIEEELCLDGKREVVEVKIVDVICKACEAGSTTRVECFIANSCESKASCVRALPLVQVVLEGTREFAEVAVECVPYCADGYILYATFKCSIVFLGRIQELVAYSLGILDKETYGTSILCALIELRCWEEVVRYGIRLNTSSAFREEELAHICVRAATAFRKTVRRCVLARLPPCVQIERKFVLSEPPDADFKQCAIASMYGVCSAAWNADAHCVLTYPHGVPHLLPDQLEPGDMAVFTVSVSQESKYSVPRYIECLVELTNDNLQLVMGALRSLAGSFAFFRGRGQYTRETLCPHLYDIPGMPHLGVVTDSDACTFTEANSFPGLRGVSVKIGFRWPETFATKDELIARVVSHTEVLETRLQGMPDFCNVDVRWCSVKFEGNGYASHTFVCTMSTTLDNIDHVFQVVRLANEYFDDDTPFMRVKKALLEVRAFPILEKYNYFKGMYGQSHVSMQLLDNCLHYFAYGADKKTTPLVNALCKLSGMSAAVLRFNTLPF